MNFFTDYFFQKFWVVQKAVTADPSLAKGVNTLNGHITHPALAESLSMDFRDLEEILS